MTAVQLYDDPHGDRAAARYACFEAPSLFAAQFVMIECAASGRTFLGNVTGPNLNFNRNALSPTDNTAINQLEQITRKQMNRDVAIKEVFFYEIALLREIVNGRPESVRVRPQIGAMARKAEDAEIIKYLNLPEINPNTQIGTIIDTTVPICISKRIVMEHFLVGGSTGSGKTNTIANIASAGVVGLGMSGLVFDHKPDYQHLHMPNDEGEALYFKAIPSVEYWYIGQPFAAGGRKESRIKVAAHDLSPTMLANTIFHNDGEERQAESCDFLMRWFRDEIMKGADWTVYGFIDWLLKTPCAHAPGQQHPETYRSMQSKILRPGRIPDWIDEKPGRTRAFASSAVALDPVALIKPGHASVIRVASESSDGREYGLLLSHILNRINQAAERHALPCPVMVVIDEAQDIFSASRQLKQASLGMLDRNIRKGRSKGIGYVIGVQAADAVPDSILNNLNSRIIHRHNSHEQVRVAANMATEDQRRMTNTFGAGEALTYVTGSNGIIHARMRRSPFKLTKEDV